MVRVNRVIGFLALVAALSGCNDNSVVGLPADIQANPDDVTFGRVEQNGDLGQVVLVSNVGDDVLTVTNAWIEPADAPYRIDGVLPSSAAPWKLRKGEWKPLDVHFAPHTVGVFAATLVIESDDVDEPQLQVPLGGDGYTVVVDTYTQGTQTGGLADILFVVDNSGSMSEEQTKLGNSFSTFINWLVGANVDYRIAVTTTDMVDATHQGRFRGNPKVITPQTPDVVNAFKANVDVGATGSATEKGLDGGLAAISEPLLSGENAGFLRPEARLYVVYVTDENDASSGTPQSYVDQTVMVKGGDPTKAFFAAIAGPTPSGCFTFGNSADAGTRYRQVIDATGGLFGSICDSDFGVTLQNLAFEVTAASGEFFLTDIPDPATIEVYVAGALEPTGHWTYNAGTNSVKFLDPWVPVAGAVVAIHYEGIQ